MSYHAFGFNGFGQFSTAATETFNGRLDHLGSRLLRCLSVSWNSMCWITDEDGSMEIRGFGIATGHSVKELNKFCSGVAFVTCSSSHLVVIDKNGLGHILKWTSNELEEIFTFPSEGSETTKLKECYVGDTDVTFLSDVGRVLWVSLRSSKLEAEMLNVARKVKKISCGKEHVLILTDLGMVYSFGQGSRGQLGHGVLDSESDPRLVECVEGIEIKELAAGGWHSAAVSSDGDLYMWGWNESGQLGFPTKSSNQPSEEGTISIQAVPKVVDFSREICVKSVSCGSRHTAVVADDGSLWTFGRNAYGQLGFTSSQSIATPTEVAIVDKLSMVWCGGWSTVVRRRSV